MRTVKSIFKTFVDVIHFRRADMTDGAGGGGGGGGAVDGAVADGGVGGGLDGFRGISDSSQQQQFSAERVAEFRRFASAGSAYERLVKSFAPSIWEMDDVKRG
jgi:DNA replication licensing factor MCM4